MTFRSDSLKLKRAFEKRRLTVINKVPSPASDICNNCWYQAKCLLRIMQRDRPGTCCVYTLFTESSEKQRTLEDTVAYTCENKCVARQSWQGDPVPHNANYCENHCPVSGFILNRAASEEDEVPKIGEF